jgi:hypothetical protein
MMFPMSANLMGLVAPNMNPQQPEPQSWWDQNNRRDRAAMMLAAAGDAFGNMTLRGRQGSNPFGQAAYAQASQNIKNNRTLEYLKKNHPDMYQLAMQVGTENLPTIINQMMKNKVSGGSDYQQYLRDGGKLSYEDYTIMQDGTAGMKNFRFGQNLPEDQREAFLNSLGPGAPFRVVDDPGGGLLVLDSRTGQLLSRISNEDAQAGASQVAAASKLGESLTPAFDTAYNAVETQENNLTSLIDGQNTLMQFIESYEQGNVDTGILVGRLGRIAPGLLRMSNDELLNLANMEQDKVANLLRQLGIENFAPVTIAEIQLLSRTFLDPMNSEAYNRAMADSLLERMAKQQETAQRNLQRQLGRVRSLSSSDAARNLPFFQQEYQRLEDRLNQLGYLNGF